MPSSFGHSFFGLVRKLKHMKTRITLLAGFALYLTMAVVPCNAQSSSGKTAQKLFDMVVGTWKLDTAYNYGGKKMDRNASSPGDMKSIEFTREAKYIVRNQSMQASDSGFYRANEDHKLIYLQSSIRQGQPSEWHASLKNATLTLVQEQPGDKKPMTYVYHRHGNSGDTAAHK